MDCPDPRPQATCEPPNRLVLAALIALALASSWWGLGRQGLMMWDEGVYFDEARFVVQAAHAVRTHTSIAAATMGFAPRMARPLNVALNAIAMAALGVHPWVPAALTGLLGALAIAGTYLLGRRAWDEDTGRLGALFLLVSPYFLQYRRMGLAEAGATLAALLVTLRLLALREQPERRPWLNSLGLGVLLGLAFTVNSRLGVLAPVAGLFRLCWLDGPVAVRRLLGHAVVLALGAAAVILAFELPYRLLPLVVATPVPVESYFAQLARFAQFRSEDAASRPPLSLTTLACAVFLLHFDAPITLLALVGAIRGGLRRRPGPTLVIVCLLTQLAAVGLITPAARYLAWVLPLVAILAASGLMGMVRKPSPRAGRAVLVGALVLCLAYSLWRVGPILGARGAMRDAVAWLAARPVATVVTSDQSLAMAYTNLPLAALPAEPEAARSAIAVAGAGGPCYVLLDRQQFVAGGAVLIPEEYERSAAGLIGHEARPCWTAPQFRGLFMPFCFEHNRDVRETVRAAREFAREGEVISLYTAEEALRALAPADAASARSPLSP